MARPATLYLEGPKDHGHIHFAPAERRQTAYKISRSARAIAQERFNIKRLVADTEELYQELLRQKNILA